MREPLRRDTSCRYLPRRERQPAPDILQRLAVYPGPTALAFGLARDLTMFLRDQDDDGLKAGSESAIVRGEIT